MQRNYHCDNDTLFVREYPEVPVPKKGTKFSVGYDLACVRFHSKLNDFTYLYDTGLRVKPPTGYYFEVVPRSSLVKTNWVLANSTGIIDPDYSGTIKVAIKTFVKEDIPQVPFTLFQFILRKQNFTEFFETDTLEKTERGDGGFGSTNR